jgi:hypothetical protein
MLMLTLLLAPAFLLAPLDVYVGGGLIGLLVILILVLIILRILGII